MSGFPTWFSFVRGQVPAPALLAVLVAVLSPAFASPIWAQQPEVGPGLDGTCDCGVLVSRLVERGIIDEKDADDAFKECIDTMCSPDNY